MRLIIALCVGAFICHLHVHVINSLALLYALPVWVVIRLAFPTNLTPRLYE